MKLLLVFGSLRKTSSRGFNFDRFGQGTQKLIKSLWIEGFVMHNLGPYPAVRKGDGAILAELHEVDDKAAERIEMMEKGAGYTALKVPVDCNGKQQEAVIYTMPTNKLLSYPEVFSGDWN